MPKEKRLEITHKALNIYSPLSRLLGLSKLTYELENNAFKIINPGDFLRLEKLVSKKIVKVGQTVEETKGFLESLLSENNIKSKIAHRVKHLYGIYRKVSYKLSKGQDPGKNLENIFDLIAMRILVNTIEECYLTENLLKQIMDHLPEEHDDFIKVPRKTGYKSIHNTFKIAQNLNMEIQIKTHGMHLINEFGQSSHLLYKIGDKDKSSQAVAEFKKYLQEDPNWFKDLNIWEREKTTSDYKSSAPFSKNVYAFTPKGDIIELIKGATIIDFAYAVHTRIGNSCIGALVNGQMVKLDYQIEDGDIVEIKTLKSKTKPSSDWLKIAKTSRTRGHIRHALKS
jgi:GTP pyrophosphokinase